MAAATIFGILSGLGNLGEQKAEAQQIADQELMRRLAVEQNKKSFGNQQEAFRSQQQTAELNRQRLQQLIQTGGQPSPLGQPFVSGGKTYQRFQNPLTGAVSTQLQAGPIPETPEESEARGMRTIGFTDDEIKETMERQYGGRGSTALKREIQPDASSPTGYSAVYFDQSGGEQFRQMTLPPRGWIPTQSSTVGNDIYGNPRYSTTTRTPLIGGLPRFPAPAMPYSGVPSGASGGYRAPIPAPTAPIGQGAPAPAAGAPASRVVPPGTGGRLNAGSYRGLLPDGTIPPGAANDLVTQYANDLITGQDVLKVPAAARGAAEKLARTYGWKGQGSLTPKDQLQIEEADQVIREMLANPKLLAVLDDPTAWKMAMVPKHVPEEAGFGPAATRIVTRQLYKTLSPMQNDYMQQINKLNSLMGGIRKITGGNVAEAQVQRYLTETPDVSTTPNAIEAKRKLMKLYGELQVAKQYGYFPKGESADLGAGAAPPPGARVRDFTDIPTTP